MSTITIRHPWAEARTCATTAHGSHDRKGKLVGDDHETSPPLCTAREPRSYLYKTESEISQKLVSSHRCLFRPTSRRHNENASARCRQNVCIKTSLAVTARPLYGRSRGVGLAREHNRLAPIRAKGDIAPEHQCTGLRDRNSAAACTAHALFRPFNLFAHFPLLLSRTRPHHLRASVNVSRLWPLSVDINC